MKKILTTLVTTLVIVIELEAQVEPNAGNWKTWFITSGKDYRLPAPPAFKNEVAQVLSTQKNLDSATRQQIIYWNGGSPGYRWQEMMNKLWTVDTGRYGALANMFGAGLIKVRGDEIWRNGTALYYHFETQPIPGPLSRWFHFLSHSVLKMGVWFNWLAELIAPFFAFWPRVARHIAGMVMVSLQIVLILSGNLSFLNWLTIVPALACFDDGFWSKILPQRLVRTAEAAATRAKPSKAMSVTAWVVTAVIALLSFRPIGNMLSPGQIMLVGLIKRRKINFKN